MLKVTQPSVEHAWPTFGPQEILREYLEDCVWGCVCVWYIYMYVMCVCVWFVVCVYVCDVWCV